MAFKPFKINKYMEEVKKDGDDASVTDAGVKPVEKNDIDPALMEILDKIPEILDENAKLKSDNENYKTGMLNYKDELKKLKRDNGLEDDNKLSSDDIVQRVVEQIKPLITPKPEQSDLAKKVSELTIALKNKSQIQVQTGAGGGSVDETKSAEKEYFSEAQIADLKARGLDPVKVKENILKYKQNSTL